MLPHQCYRNYLESLTPESLPDLPKYVTENVRFRDPFNDVHGVEAMERVFRHMFDNVAEIDFAVQHTVCEGDVCLMQWRLRGVLMGKPWNVEGASALRFAPDGRVAEHVDYWDAARGFYERLPVLGWLVSRIRRSLAVRPS